MSRKIGVVLMILGMLILTGGIVAGLTVGTQLVPILLVTSIVINSTGIVLLRGGK